jgi:hypothetical protein
MELRVISSSSFLFVGLSRSVSWVDWVGEPDLMAFGMLPVLAQSDVHVAHTHANLP